MSKLLLKWHKADLPFSTTWVSKVHRDFSLLKASPLPRTPAWTSLLCSNHLIWLHNRSSLVNRLRCSKPRQDYSCSSSCWETGSRRSRRRLRRIRASPRPKPTTTWRPSGFSWWLRSGEFFPNARILTHQESLQNNNYPEVIFFPFYSREGSRMAPYFSIMWAKSPLNAT